jgi:hypothetical protein
LTPVDKSIYSGGKSLGLPKCIAVTALPPEQERPVSISELSPPVTPPGAANVARPGSGAPAGAAPAAASQTSASAADDAEEDDDEYEYEDEGVSSRTVRLLASCGVSLVVHFSIILALGLLTMAPTAKSKAPVIQASVEERPIEEVFERLEQKIEPATQLNPMSTSAAAAAVQGVQGAIAAVTAPPKLNTEVSENVTTVRVDVGAVNVFTTSGAEFASAVPNGTMGEAMGTADGYGEAMDILTREILNRLSRGKVLVVWLFDQSLSMKDDQKEIRDRIELVYKELDLSVSVKDDALLTGVVSYGKSFAVHTQKPTNMIEEIKAAIDAVPVDESGEEMMCSAVGQTAVTFRSLAVGGRQTMIVLVSDESGNQQDNIRTIEPCIQVCKEAKASVYCIGREAVFSYPYAHMNWPVTVPAIGGGTITRNFVVAVDRGPESPYVELLQTEGFQKREDAHPSGFGPYEQVRIARETGGMFLMLPSPEARVFRRDATKFEFEQMRPYLPDLRSREQYVQERDYSPLRSLIWKVINDLNPYKPEIARYINLKQAFAADPGRRASEIDAELNKAKTYIEYLTAAEKAMKEAAKHRDREKSPRWRAHYDLILAQIIAYRARVFEYGIYLQAFKTQPKPFDPPTPKRVLDYWDLRERGKTLGAEKTQPDIDEATRLFNAVIQQYPGTPWATRAAYELRRGWGIDLVAIYRNPNPPPPTRRPAQPIRTPKI